MAISAFLRDFGHEVTVASDGRQALEKLNESDFDAVLMDVRMPEMNGLEVTRRIRAGETACRSDVPIIALTAYAMDEERRTALDAGVDAHMAKPVDFNKLDKKIRELVLGRERGG
jgi:two-component system sensor histidine kinase EvgS